MFKYILLVFSISAFQCEVQSQSQTHQYIRQLNLVRPQEIVDIPGNYQQQTILTETPCSCSQLPTTQLPVAQLPIPSTTIITDCSPTACKNLANTLQLMIVCNLLEKTRGGSELALQLAAPIINELFTSPALSCGCANPFATNLVSPNLVSPSAVSPNLISGFTNVVSSSAPLLTYATGGLLSGAL